MLIARAQAAMTQLRYDAQRDSITQFSRRRRVAVRNLRVIAKLFKLETYRRVELHAQALTMKSLLALVPLLAVSFALFKWLGGLEDIESRVQEWIIANLSGSSEELQQAITDFIGSVRQAKIGAFSLVVLTATVFSLLNHIENSFNALFGETKGRGTRVRFVSYWSLLVFGPVLLGASLALTAALQTAVGSGWMSQLGGLVRLGVAATPLVATWFAFTLLYFVVPSTRVRLSSACISAIVAGSMWNGAKWGFAYYAKHAVTVRDVYGSLATIPMFILWIYVSWLLILFGAQLCAALHESDRRQAPPTVDITPPPRQESF